VSDERGRLRDFRRSLLIDDAAVALGVSRRTVYYRIREGRLQTIRTRCESQRVLVSSIEELRSVDRDRRLPRSMTFRLLRAPTALSESSLRATPRATRSGNGLEIVVPLTDKLIPTLTKIEGEMIRMALRSSQGRVDAAARALGISRKGLYLKRQRLGL